MAMNRNNKTYYFYQDGLGSTTEVVESGLTKESYSYDPYGKATIKDLYGTVLPNSAIGNPYLFTGRELDQETGNYYYRARHYHPGIGRFLQRDPLGYFPDNNLYRYVNNNPVNWVDPFGFKAKNPYRAPGGSDPDSPPWNRPYYPSFVPDVLKEPPSYQQRPTDPYRDIPWDRPYYPSIRPPFPNLPKSYRPDNPLWFMPRPSSTVGRPSIIQPVGDPLGISSGGGSGGGGGFPLLIPEDAEWWRKRF